MQSAYRAVVHGITADILNPLHLIRADNDKAADDDDDAIVIGSSDEDDSNDGDAGSDDAMEEEEEEAEVVAVQARGKAKPKAKGARKISEEPEVCASRGGEGGG